MCVTSGIYSLYLWEMPYSLPEEISTLSLADSVVPVGRQILFLGKACMKAFRLPLWFPAPDHPQEDRCREGLARSRPVAKHLPGLGPLFCLVGSPRLAPQWTSS